MSDIFISYASADKVQASLLAEKLSEQGWLVWWDRQIQAGQSFDEVIEEALNSAKCIIVLWSQNSTTSRWVKTEAAEGVARGILVPVLIEKVNIPLEFKRIEAADLSDWRGKSHHIEFNQLLMTIEKLLNGTVSISVPPKPLSTTQKFKKWWKRILIGAAVAIGLASAVFTINTINRHDESENSSQKNTSQVTNSFDRFLSADKEEKESNDQVTTANVVAFGATIQGKLSSAKDRDFFVFKTPHELNSEVRIILRKMFFAKVDVYNADEKFIKGDLENGDKTISFSFEGQPDSTYYLLIKPYGNEYGDYELVIR
ncbi:toll/interleukin-1 receptor domain-containing protein [Methylomonas methanica]|uniref:TIR domain-containing protein n=1 Tax=Methylomonas methanica (strain DSM 25384 / MC09) TaxID=857087 RepID=G0A0L6_METMM|nr:toll/interleukin-1 receptor domain-containing protein [Methylomonas methanica]AEF98792.1 Domain of unknown function DUF1863 [Methylomonas methanica MC09]